MKWKWLLYITILPLLIASFAGCSKSDEPENTSDGLIMVNRMGKKVLIKERNPYPDSVSWHRHVTIPCKPVAKKDLPDWLYDIILDECLLTYQCSVYQGKWVDSGKVVYTLRTPPDPVPLFFVFNSEDQGERLNIYEYFGYNGYHKFLDSTTGWRMIYELSATIIND